MASWRRLRWQIGTGGSCGWPFTLANGAMTAAVCRMCYCGPHNEVRATGFNGFPRGVDDKNEAGMPDPTSIFGRSTQNEMPYTTLLDVGTSLAGCWLYANRFPCMDCARAIVQTGITKVVTIKPELSDPHWGRTFGAAVELLPRRESGWITLMLKRIRPAIANDIS